MSTSWPIGPAPKLSASTEPHMAWVARAFLLAGLFLAGCTASPLYHKHPHVPEEHVLPDDIKEQTRRALANIKIILDSHNLTWRNVVKLTKYLTDMREMDAMYEVLVEHFGDWTPAGTLVAINNLSAPGARIELDMIAAVPA